MGPSKHVLAVLFAEFDTKEGPVIASQWPEGFVSKDVWTSLYEYVIPKLDIANRVVSIAHPRLRGRGGFRLVGAPMVISDAKYARNAYTFNLCVALDLRRVADVTRVDAALRAHYGGDARAAAGVARAAAQRTAAALWRCGSGTAAGAARSACTAGKKPGCAATRARASEHTADTSSLSLSLAFSLSGGAAGTAVAAASSCSSVRQRTAQSTRPPGGAVRAAGSATTVARNAARRARSAW